MSAIKRKIIKRLKKGFGFNFSFDCPYHHHGGRGLFAGGWSWGLTNGAFDIGSMFPMTECLKWERWIYDSELHEIFEYIPAKAEEYNKCDEIIVEKLTEK